MPDGSDERDEEPDPATRKWDESEFLDDRYTEPDETQPFDVEPDIPEAPAPENADAKLQARFWSLVVIFNITILAVSIGGLFILFRENLELGVQLLFAGLLIGAYGLYRYRTTKESLYDDQNG